MSVERTIRFVMVSLLLASALPAWAQRGAGRNIQRGMGSGTCQSLLDSVPKAELDLDEATELAYLREEEKLARDVYIALYESNEGTFYRVRTSRCPTLEQARKYEKMLEADGYPDAIVVAR